jgi:hypothetical protein
VDELQQPSSMLGQHCSELRQQPPLSHAVYSFGQLCAAAGETTTSAATAAKDAAHQDQNFDMTAISKIRSRRLR